MIFIRISHPAGEHAGSELSPTATECIFFTNSKVILNFTEKLILKAGVRWELLIFMFRRVFFKLFHKAKESHVLQKFL